MSGDPLQPLRDADRRLDQAGLARRSLAPDRGRATTLTALGERAARELAPAALAALAEGLAALAEAIRTHFPDNLFWDLDAVAGQLCAGALAERDDAGAAARLADVCQRLVRLHALYGDRSAIRFRYIHDLTYAFDWARWVSKEPASRAGVGPFDPAFLTFSETRGAELLVLIEADDGTYPRLRDGRHRNPFGFSREPSDEAALLGELASRGQLPLETWRWEAEPRWQEDWGRIRKALAVELGMQQPGA